MNSTYRKLSNLGKCPPSHVESADPCKKDDASVVGYMILGWCLWSFDPPWLDWCSCLMMKKPTHCLDSKHILRNCVIGSLSGWQAASYVSVWRAWFCQLHCCLPRLWRSWVSWSAESTAVAGKGRDWIVECADRKEGTTGSIYDFSSCPLKGSTVFLVICFWKVQHQYNLSAWVICMSWDILLSVFIRYNVLAWVRVQPPYW